MWLLQSAISIKLNVVYSPVPMFRLFQEPVKVLEQSSLSILYLWFVLKVVPILHYVVPVVSTLNISKRNIGQSSINPLLFTFSGPSRLLIYSWVSVDQRSNIAKTKASRDTFTLSFESSELKVLDSSWRMFIIQGIEYYQKNWEKSCRISLKKKLNIHERPDLCYVGDWIFQCNCRRILKFQRSELRCAFKSLYMADVR
jgi:hypothetical protein